MDYYVYLYLREDGSPYYVGKGRRYRCNTTHGRIPVPPKNRIVKHSTNLSNDEALVIERNLIEKYGREIDGGILLNLQEGGHGAQPGNQYARLRKKTSRDQKCRDKIRKRLQGNRNGLKYSFYDAIKILYLLNDGGSITEYCRENGMSRHTPKRLINKI